MMPGMRAWLAISRKQRRDILNLRRYPRARPVNWHRLRNLVGEEFLGSLFRESTAASRSSSLLLRSFTIFFSSCLRSHFSLTRRSRLFCFANKLFLAIISFSLFLPSGTFLTLFSVRVCFI